MSFQLKKETAVKLRTKLGVADDVGDEKLAEQAFDTFLAAQEQKPDAAQTAAMSKLEADNAAIKAELEAEKGKVVAMSRQNPQKVDDVTAILYSESIATKRDIAINNGAIDPHVAKEIDALFFENGAPSAVAMSILPGINKTRLARLWEVLANNKPQALGEKTGRQTVSMSRLTEGDSEEDKKKAEEEGRKQGEAYKNAQLKARGLAPTA